MIEKGHLGYMGAASLGPPGPLSYFCSPVRIDHTHPHPPNPHQKKNIGASVSHSLTQTKQTHSDANLHACVLFPHNPITVEAAHSTCSMLSAENNGLLTPINKWAKQIRHVNVRQVC